MDKISLRGVRTHNLKNIDLDLPRDKLIVITGLSGSGKSSLAFDTLYAEGQRRYVESLSAYARQFLSMMDKPELDTIEGLSPAISIEQKSTSHNPRSTVGTVTEIYDYLRLLFARVGQPRCPEHGEALDAQTISQMVDHVLNLDAGSSWMILAPVVKDRKGSHQQLLQQLCAQGFVRVLIDGEIYLLDDPPSLALRKKHHISVVVDRFKIRPDLAQRLAESFETALKLAAGLVEVRPMADPDAEVLLFSENFACKQCGYSLAALEPRLFSFNSPAGACTVCDGLGTHQFFDPQKVVKQPDLSLAEGAIKGWDKRSRLYYQWLQCLAAHVGFDLNAPFSSLTEREQSLVLYGSGTDILDCHWHSKHGEQHKRQAFEGVIPNLQRRYHETDSDKIRDELSRFMSQQPCGTCAGTRLNPSARHVFIQEHNLPMLTQLPIAKLLLFVNQLQMTGWRGEIVAKIRQEISSRLQFLVNVGLNYLNLGRSAETLSGGEAQRIRLASQIGAGLVGVMYILDEPSIGLHQRDNARLLKTLFHLRDLGNTVIVVEHDEEAIRSADHIVDIGPGAGAHGGEVVAAGDYQTIIESSSLTGQYLSGLRQIAIPKRYHKANKDQQLQLYNACGNNLQKLNLSLPVGLFTCVTGVSGSGKSTLINDTLYPLVANHLHHGQHTVAPYGRISGLDHLDKVVDIDQSPIGRTPRSNPATYTGLFTPIRELFTAVPESRARGYKAGRFSFNVKGGRCETCKGDGVIKVEMHFLPDVYVACDICQGQRYNRETLAIHYKDKTIAEVLAMTVEEAWQFFSAIPVIKRKLDTLMAVGLSYLTLGQNAVTLSGGEAQRVKLARELSKRDTGRTLYILDEPTTGLHFHDIALLLKVLHQLRDNGNTVVVIEHNLDVIKTADWIIDLGPEGGENGGQIIATGNPRQVSKLTHSYTGQFLAPLFAKKGK